MDPGSGFNVGGGMGPGYSDEVAVISAAIFGTVAIYQMHV